MLRLVYVTLAVFGFSLALTSYAHAGDVVNITVAQHQEELMTLPKAMTRVLIANRKVAGVVKHSGRKVSIIGHKLGATNIRFMNGRRIVRQVNVTVTEDLPAIRQKLSELFPDEEVGVTLVNKSVALTGVVSDAETARNIVRITEKMIGQNSEVQDLGDKGVVNLMKLRTGQQVMLRVQIGEIRRDAVKNLGLGAHAVITQGNAVLGALEKNSLFKVLAEPNLVAISGETANFLAGGEIPLPVPQDNGNTAVTYKPFGVSVNYTPFVLAQNRIRLKVQSEVSEIGKSIPMTANTYSIPSISTRKADTTVELAPGESFMIAGLMKDNMNADISEIPGLGSIPILSALFRSVEFQHHETELVIAVTPYLVDPIEHKDLKLPTDNFQMPSTMGMIFFGDLSAKHQKDDNTSPTQGLEGPVGFMLD